MTTELTKKYTVSEVSKIDKENRELVGFYSASKIKITLELAMRLKEFEDGKLYLKLDEASYPDFPTYLKSLGVNYKTAREIIGLYETYVLISGFSIDELAKYAYHMLTIWKPHFFAKEAGQYKQLETKADMKKLLSESKELTQEDTIQRRREIEAGEHEHIFDEILIRRCKVCKLTERLYEKTKKEAQEENQA